MSLVRILIEVDLDDEHMLATLTVRPRVPLMTVAQPLRLLVEGIETGQVASVRLGGRSD
jgi:hypothetical protein